MPPVGRVNITAADAVGTAPITTIELPDNGGKPPPRIGRTLPRWRWRMMRIVPRLFPAKLQKPAIP